MTATTNFTSGTIVTSTWLNAIDASVFDYVVYARNYATGDGTTDDTTNLQVALNAATSVVDGSGATYKITSSITIPAGITLRNANILVGTSAINAVLVNTRSKLLNVKITGTGTTGIIERGIYPAANGVTDVELVVEVTNMTVGVHAQYITTDTEANYPKRWYGNIYIHDIVGLAANSEGYGVLLSPAQACHFTIHAKTIARHALYLAAGARDNDVDITVDGCTNYAVQLYSTSGQTATQYNTVKVNCKNLSESVATQSGAVAIVQKAHYNTVIVNMEGSGTTSEAVRVEGASGGPYPLSNKIIDGNITGQFTGADVIKLINADSTIITNNRLDAYATAAVISSRRTGTNGITHGGYIYNNQINAQAQSIRGIYAEVTTVPTYIGINDIRNNGSGLRVDDSTSGKRYGYSRRITFSGTTASISATSSGDTTVTLSDNLQTTNRYGVVNLTGSSAQYFDKPFWSAISLAPSETQLTFRAYNGHSAGQTFTYSGFVEGD